MSPEKIIMLIKFENMEICTSHLDTAIGRYSEYSQRFCDATEPEHTAISIKRYSVHKNFIFKARDAYNAVLRETDDY